MSQCPAARLLLFLMIPPGVNLVLKIPKNANSTATAITLTNVAAIVRSTDLSNLPLPKSRAMATPMKVGVLPHGVDGFSTYKAV